MHNAIAMSPRTTPTEITTANTTEISNRNSAGAESDSSIDLAIKEFVGAVGKAGRQYVMLSGMRSFRLSIELFRYAALLREYMRIETIIKHLLFLLNLSRFLKGPLIFQDDQGVLMNLFRTQLCNGVLQTLLNVFGGEHPAESVFNLFWGRFSPSGPGLWMRVLCLSVPLSRRPCHR